MNRDDQLEFWYRQVDQPGASWRQRFSDWQPSPGDGNWSTLEAALELARSLALAEEFSSLPAEQQLAVVVCLSHSESLADQDLALAAAASPAVADDALDAWLRERHEVIRLYRRFPARNRALRRASTPAEAYFVVGFGQQFR